MDNIIKVTLVGIVVMITATITATSVVKKSKKYKALIELNNKIMSDTLNVNHGN